MFIVEEDRCRAHRAHVRHHDLIRRFKAIGLIRRLQARIGEDRLKLVHRKQVVDLIHIAVILRLEHLLRDGLLRGVYALRTRARRRLVHAGERKQRRNIIQVSRLLRVCAIQIEVLIQRGRRRGKGHDVPRGIGKIGSHAKAQQRRHAHFAQHLRVQIYHLVQRRCAVDGVQIGADRRNARCQRWHCGKRDQQRQQQRRHSSEYVHKPISSIYFVILK